VNDPGPVYVHRLAWQTDPRCWMSGIEERNLVHRRLAVPRTGNILLPGRYVHHTLVKYPEEKNLAFSSLYFGVEVDVLPVDIIKADEQYAIVSDPRLYV